jgi:hypothetical protein
MISQSIIFQSESLMPELWRESIPKPWRTFNPALAALPGGGYALAYRVVGADLIRRIAICKLTDSFDIENKSCFAFSDRVFAQRTADLPKQAYAWLADPRFVWWQNNLYMYWNSGVHAPANEQWIQQIDPHSLRPLGHPRHIVKLEHRNQLEKNWGLFEFQNNLHAIYSYSPLLILRMQRQTEDAIIFEETIRYDCALDALGKYEVDMRGGAPPIMIGDDLICMTHWRSRPVLRHQYHAGVFIANIHKNLAPQKYSSKPLELRNPFRNKFQYKPLNGTVDKVIYPCGLVRKLDTLIASYGINDEHVALEILPLTKVTEAADIEITDSTAKRSFLSQCSANAFMVKERFMHKLLKLANRWQPGRIASLETAQARFTRRMLILRACFWLLALQPWLSILPFGWQKRWIERERPYKSTISSDDEIPKMIGLAVQSAAKKFPWSIVCYPQALVAHTMLTNLGLPSELHVGLSLKNIQLKGHAWVSSNGQFVIGEENANAFTKVVTYSNS